MGELIDGVWVTNAMDSVIKDGVLHRPPSIFRNWLTADGTAPAGAHAATRLKPGAIISMFRSPAPGRIARSSCAT